MALRSNTQRGLLLAFIGSICLCGLVGVYCLIVGGMGRLEERILATTATVGGCSILALAAAIPWERRRWHPIGPIGIGAILGTLVLTVSYIWVSPRYPESSLWEKGMALAWVCAVALPHIGLISLARLKSQWTIFQGITVVIISILAGQIIASILLEIHFDWWFRAMGVFGIVATCGTIAVPILHRVSGMRMHDTVHTSELHINLSCPVCSTAQQLPAGRSACKLCGLKIRIEIEEHNCAKCGYPLYLLQSAVCPECGTPIARAGAAAAALPAPNSP